MQKPKSSKGNNRKIMLSSTVKCVIVESQNLSNARSALLSSLRRKTPLSEIPLVGPLLF